MKKVLFTATVDSHILQFHIPYLKMFKEKGYEVHVATNGTEEIPYCDVKHVISFERSPIKINNLKAIKDLKKIIDKEKFDIIHCHTPMGSVVTRIAAKKARKRGTRVIYTAHGFHFFKGAPLLNWIIFYPIEKHLSKYTDCLITINQEDYELAKRKFKAKQIELVHGVGVDESKFNFEMTKEEKHELRESLGLKDDDFVIIYVAELSKRKNQGMLIKAVKELIDGGKTNIKVLLPGTDSMNGYYQKMSKDLGIEENIKFLGYRKDIPKLLKISDLYVSTAKQEGLPVNIMEAMFCGLPILATDCRGNSDLVENLIKANDLSELNKRIIDTNNNKEEYNYDISNYIEQNVIKKVEEIYNNVDKKSIIMLRSTAIKNDSRIQKERKAFREEGHKVKIIGWDRNKEFGSKELFENMELFRIKSTYGSGMKNLFKLAIFQIYLANKLIKYRKEYDIIFACDLDTGIMARIVSKILKKKMIYDIYDYYIDCHNLPKVLNKFAENQEIKNINYADITIICTEQRKEQIKKADPKKLIVIHNSPEIPENIKGMKSIIQGKSNKIKIVYVGILQDDRLLVEVGEIIKENPQYELHIGGFGKYEDYFKDLAENYENIFFYGTLEYEKVLKLESECDVLFATYNPEIKNHKYSAPNKFYEAMALGKPIIVCKDTGIDKLVDENELGICIQYNKEDFKYALNKIEEKKYNNSIDLYNKTYSWKTMKGILLSIL